jgi:hypothetical protein
MIESKRTRSAGPPFRGISWVLVATSISVGMAIGSVEGRDIDPLVPPVTDYNNSYPFERPLAYHVVRPYHEDNFLYGYFDHVYGRGPAITLGDGTLLPGFRGYGLFGSPGYGRGLRPTSFIDLSRYRPRDCFGRP